MLEPFWSLQKAAVHHLRQTRYAGSEPYTPTTPNA